MLTQDLPIYNDIRAYCSAYIGVFEKMKRLHKYYIGKDIYEMSLSLFEMVERANKSRDAAVKVAMYDDLGTVIDGILIRLRLADEHGIISHRQHARLSDALVLINKQVSGMKNTFRYEK